MKINKEQLKNDALNVPYNVGDEVFVKGLGSQSKEGWVKTGIISEIKENGVLVDSPKFYTRDVIPFDCIKHKTYDVGFNPFPKRNFKGEPRSVNFTLYSIIHMFKRERTPYTTKKGFKINDYSFDPYVEIEGEKHYYQRDLVWTLDDKQQLLDSIFNRINCGSIIVRRRSFAWNETRESEADTSFLDVVDGKQRINAILEFMDDGFPDSNGYYYSEYSDRAQHELLDHQLFTYSEFGEEAIDQDVIEQFLKVNFTGKPQSKEHIELVKNINNKFLLL